MQVLGFKGRGWGREGLPEASEEEQSSQRLNRESAVIQRTVFFQICFDSLDLVRYTSSEPATGDCNLKF